MVLLLLAWIVPLGVAPPVDAWVHQPSLSPSSESRYFRKTRIYPQHCVLSTCRPDYCDCSHDDCRGRLSTEYDDETRPSNDSTTSKVNVLAKSDRTHEYPTQRRIDRRHFLSAMGGGIMTIASILATTPFDSTGAATTANLLSSETQEKWPKVLGGDLPVPFSSVRKYKSITLANGLRVLLVSDKQQRDFCSAAMSIGGAGQFSDPENLPGLAHLCEHMILSVALSKGANPIRRAQDFEDWISLRDGASNGYTAYDNVCFHYSMVGRGGPTTTTGYFQEALDRFAGIFQQENAERAFANEEILRREIRRVNSELDLASAATQSFFLTKDFVNSEHPFSRLGLGNLESLEVKPREAGIRVSDQLARFFRRYYQPKQAVLVVVGSQEINTLLRWVGPFATSLSKQQQNAGASFSQNRSIRRLQEQLQKEDSSQIVAKERYYPGRFLQGGNRLKHLVLARERQPLATDNTERLSFEWILNFDYSGALREGDQVITAAQMAFMISQILSRRGPGSLYFFLFRRGWVPRGSIGIPKVSVPVEVSGFQMIKLEILLTLEGFINKSAVVAAVYEALDGVKVSRELVTQWATVAKLFGYALASRPPDAVELSQDTHTYGVDPVWSIGYGNWYRFPSPEDRPAMRALVKSLSNTLDNTIRDPDCSVIIATAGPRALAETSLPLLTSTKWNVEPISGGLFLYEDMLGLASRVEELVLTRIINREELLRPVFNPLVPLTLRSTRLSDVEGVLNGNLPQQRRGLPRIKEDPIFALQDDWIVLFPETLRLPMPRGPPESSYRSALVIQLLSARPARARFRQAAQGELWKISLEAELEDLAESGALGALAYDISFNKYGMRVAVLGISQNVSSYARRLFRRLVRHSEVLLSGDEYFRRTVYDAAISEVSRLRGISPQRRRQLISSIRRSSAYEASVEGIALLKSCDGAICFAQGDIAHGSIGSRTEVLDLALQLKDIFEKAVGPSPTKSTSTRPAVPDISELLYQPVWKPHAASPCAVAGVSLVADTCGRLKR